MAQILSIDDSNVVTNLIKMTLETNKDYHVSIANNAPLAFQYCQTNDFDLILVDYRMPGMTGIDFISQLREQNLQPGVPIFMLTAESGDDVKAQAKAQLINGWIRKPFQPQSLIQLVNDTLIEN